MISKRRKIGNKNRLKGLNKDSREEENAKLIIKMIKLRI